MSARDLTLLSGLFRQATQAGVDVADLADSTQGLLAAGAITPAKARAIADVLRTRIHQGAN